MLNARLVISLVLLVFIAALLVSLVMIWVPPSDSRLAIDSYSGRGVGNRALFELLQELRVPVSRNDSTPSTLFQRRVRILMLQPDLLRVETEKAYIEQLERWVRNGGELMLVTDTLDRRSRSVGTDSGPLPCALGDLIGEDSLAAALGIAGLQVTRSPDEALEPEAGAQGEEDAREKGGQLQDEADGEQRKGAPENDQQEGAPGDEPCGEPEEPRRVPDAPDPGRGTSEATDPETEVEDEQPAPAAEAEAADQKRRQTAFEKARRLLRRHLAFFQFPETEYRTRATGTLAALGQKVRSLYLPETPAILSGEPLSRAEGSFQIELDGSWCTVAIELRHGRGTVTVVSELSPFSNLGLGEADNAVLAYHLAAGRGGREVVVDEYYHGRILRGNWIRLLGYPTYAIIALCILMASLLWAWSHGVRFGPPAPEPAPSRRSILEYIDAMALLFQRGRKHHFVLQTCRDGLLGDLTEEMRFTPGTPEAALLIRLAQLDAERAGRVHRVLRAVDQRLASRRRLSPAALVQLQEKLDSCRKSKRRNPPLTRR